VQLLLALGAGMGVALFGASLFFVHISEFAWKELLRQNIRLFGIIK
jgi:hypothetical protein